MNRPIAAAFLMFAIAAAAFAQRQRSVNPPVQGGDWKIEITTSGGFTGAGNGGLTVASDGTLTITPMSATPSTKGCLFHLSSDEVAAINGAVRNASTASWLECYTPADQGRHCCDLIQTRFTLTMNGGRNVFITTWLSGDALPDDLRALVDFLRGPAGVDSRYRPLCTTTP